jgi:hypothetical protein
MPTNGFNGILTRLPETPKLVRDVVCPIPSAKPRYTLHTYGHPRVDHRAISGWDYDAAFDDSGECTVECDLDGDGAGPLALLVDGTVFSLTAQRSVPVGGGKVVALAARGTHAVARGEDGSQYMLGCAWVRAMDPERPAGEPGAASPAAA